MPTSPSRESLAKPVLAYHKAIYVMKSYPYRNLFTAATAAFCSLATVTLVGAAQNPTNKTETNHQLSAKESKFLKDAAEGGMAEIQLGQIAQQNGSRPEIKDLGNQMVTDHSKANEELKSLAAKKGFTLPTDISPKHKGALDRLSKLGGENFDRAYLADMLKDHRTDIAEFESVARSAEDPELKAFAEKTLPTLRSHLQHIETIQSQALKK